MNYPNNLPSNCDKSIGDEEATVFTPHYEGPNPIQSFPSKPTLIFSESIIPIFSKDIKENTQKNKTSTKNPAPPKINLHPSTDSKQTFTMIMKVDDIMLSSFKNLPKMSYFTMKTNDCEKFEDIIEYDFGFSFRNFIRFFFYHFFYYFFFGPAFCAILYFWKGKPIIHNLSFMVWNYFCLSQTMEYLLILLSFILYFVGMGKGLYGCELYTIFISAIFWIFTVSIKYATMSEEKINFLHKKCLTLNEILSESTMLYKNSKEDIEKHIMKELFSVISRTDIDISLFQVQFIRDLECKVKEQLLNNDKEINGRTFYSEKEKKYSGISLVKKIISLGFEDNFDCRIFKIISVISSFLISSIPFLYKFYDGKIFEIDGGTIFISLFLLFTNAVFYYKNMNFGLNILYEYRKLAIFLSNLSQLLSPKTVLYYSKKKIFPTLDIFTPAVLESWDILHKICRNFDRKLRFRIDCFLTLAIIVNLAGALLVIFILLYPTKGLQDFYIYSVFLNVTFSFGIAVGLVRYGIIINYHYELHKNIIINNLKVYSDLSNHYSVYFDSEETKYENELYKEGTNRVKNLTSEYCIKVYSDVTNEEFLKKLRKMRHNILKSLRKISKNMMFYLDFKSKNEPFKIMGIPATSSILISVTGIIISFFIAVLQYQIKQYFINVDR